jgi:cyclohexanecarboxylate-CoA ligase
MRYETLLSREQGERFRAAGWWPDRLLVDALDAAAARHPARPALTDPRGRLTYAELAEQVERCALAFLDLGVRRGDAVTVQLPNWNEFVIVTLALERIAAVINPVAPIFRQRELRVMLRLARSVAAVVPGSFRGWDYPAMYAELRKDAPALRHVIAVGGAGHGAIEWDGFLARGAALDQLRPALAWLRPDADDVVELIFTSGTTGEPKGVLHTPNTLGAAVYGAIAALALSGDDVVHMASTFGHQTGFLYGVRLPIALGARAVYQDVWDPAAFSRLVEEEGISFSMGATPFLADIVRAPNLAEHAIGSLRTFICAGAPIPQPLADEVAGRLSVRLVPGWGMTECALATAVSHEDPVAKVVTSDGRPFPGVEVLVRDADGRTALAGEEGDLFVRGAFNFAGYVQGRRFSERFHDAEGWFETGDRARLDAEGYIRITGRSKDLIIRGGENVPVKEIEDVIIRHPRVRNVVLIGAPDERLGEIGCACIVPEAGEVLSLDDLRAFLAEQQVTRQFWPERVVLLDEFPMTPSGKVQKFRLRELVQEGAVSPAG